MENILLLPHLKQEYNEFSRVLDGFSSLKQAYKADLKSLGLANNSLGNPVPYHAGKAVYISESGLYQLIFSSRLKGVGGGERRGFCLITCFTFSLLLKINMDKTSQKVIKDPKRVEAARKGREKYMNKLKESILNNAKKGSGDTINASNETTSATNTATTPVKSTNNTTTSRSNDTYVYGVGMIAVVAIGVCVFLMYKASQASKNSSLKNRINHQNDVICFRKIYNK